MSYNSLFAKPNMKRVSIGFIVNGFRPVLLPFHPTITLLLSAVPLLLIIWIKIYGLVGLESEAEEIKGC